MNHDTINPDAMNHDTINPDAMNHDTMTHITAPRPRRRLLRPVAALAATLLVTACGASASSTPSVHAGGSASQVSNADLLAQRRAAGIATCPTVPTHAPAVTDALPEVTLDCLGGDSRVNLAALANGHPTIVNVWASYCGPCRTEGPLLARLHRRFPDNQRLQMVGVDYGDPSPDAAIELAKQLGMTYPMLADPDSTLHQPLRLSAIPQTFFVDAQGHVVHRAVKYYANYADLTADVQRYLGVSA